MVNSRRLKRLQFFIMSLIAAFSHVVFAQAQQARPDKVIASFESPNFDGWETRGDAFGDGPTEARNTRTQGYRGTKFANSFGRGDNAFGEITSPPFRLDRNYLCFLICGGRQENRVGMELLIEDAVVRTATGSDSELLRWVSWDVREFAGKEARLRIFDRSAERWGQITVDEIILSDAPRSGLGLPRLEEYRKSPEYYRERFRPQFHFTPEIFWMNDPNGTVYHAGKYHLFYQHNPHGNEWGHMSWGHAVSEDFVHWEHWPIALHEEYGIMAFSGSCVSDPLRTSGFGSLPQIPMIAIYSGHGLGKQTQDIAYSLDDGRTWTKYEHNPVLDLDLEDFRDPKVFWYEPEKKWVMVVSLAAAKKVHFYESKDLKSWRFLSEFGPAGVQDKPNWECPDLFELPIENEPGASRWVLEVDIGSGAIAGGSGGEYFTGTFDGRTFVADSLESQWVDFGRDFYAPVSWNGGPSGDQRRIWIGWMNNWETALNPTYPWRSAMSIPRQLSLRRIDGQLRLCQMPVAEIERLVQSGSKRVGLLTAGSHPISIRGQSLMIHLKWSPIDASQFGIDVLKHGESEYTRIGYDRDRQELFVDRTHSGITDFHPSFAGRHAGKLLPDASGSIRMTILVDHCSVEVFGNDGETVITDLVFPSTESNELAFFTDGKSEVTSEIMILDSVWHPQSNTE